MSRPRALPQRLRVDELAALAIWTTRCGIGYAGQGVGLGYCGVKDPLELVYSPWATHV